MHLEVLVEDQSGKKLLDAIIPKIIDGRHTFRVHAYKGIGRIPKGLKGQSQPVNRILLDQLPRLLQGYGNAFYGLKDDQQAHVAVICDLDERKSDNVLNELKSVLSKCKKKPSTIFCLAVEEGEAWLLGDKAAVTKAYPKANKTLLRAYKYDSICGTWERLADMVYPGGATALSRFGWQAVGYEKTKWAEAIGCYVDSEQNRSPSFQEFQSKLKAQGF